MAALGGCLALAAAAAAGSVPATLAEATAAEAGMSESVPEGWVLTWSDEFDGPAGTPPDPQVWGYDLGDGAANGLIGWGNNELQWYADEPENAALDGEGHLVISALEATGEQECYYGPCQYTSARLLTKDRFTFRHGYLEARLRVPPGFGLWPAFWLLGSDIDEVSWPTSGEIDVMEFVGRRPNELFGTVHGPGYSGSSGISGRFDLGRPVAGEFHTVALQWEPERLAWFVDEELYHEVTSRDVEPNEWVFEQPFFMLLNVAVGGNLGGPIFPDTVFPARMLVDHVRLYQPEAP
jgi:beta-glucanase (GH16 family)